MQLIEITFFSEDVPAMTDFYRRLLGAEPAVHSEDMAIFMAGDTKVFIHKTYNPEPGGLPPENHHALAVDDVDAACTRLVDAGLRLEVPPQDYYWGRSAYLRDPDGRLLEITHAGS